MLRISSLWKLFSLSLLVHAAASVAQQQPQNSPRPGEAPPQIMVEEGPNTKNGRISVEPKPAPGAVQIQEKKEGGRATEAKVKSGASEYTIRPTAASAGNAQPGEVTGGSNARAAQWTILEFDLNKKKKAEGEAAADAPPPPQAAPAAAKPAKK